MIPTNWTNLEKLFQLDENEKNKSQMNGPPLYRNNMKVSLGIPKHAWLHSCKITSSICSFNRHVPACKKSTLYLQ